MQPLGDVLLPLLPKPPHAVGDEPGMGVVPGFSRPFSLWTGSHQLLQAFAHAV